MHVVAFIVGLVALTNADVRDVLRNQQNVYSTGQPFAKQQQHQNIASAAGNEKRFWWADSNSPFSKSNAGSDFSSPQNTIHITPPHYQQQKLQLPPQHHTKRQDCGTCRQQQNIYAQMASLSGSPSEVNNLMADSFSPRYQQAAAAPKIPCYGALQVCAPKNACRNGFISEKDLSLVQTQANVSTFLCL